MIRRLVAALGALLILRLLRGLRLRRFLRARAKRAAHADYDVAVIGGGPAGLVAATVAAQSGAQVVLFDSSDRVGGLLGMQLQPLQGPRSIFGGINGVELTEALRVGAASAGVTTLLSSPVTAIDAGRPHVVNVQGRRLHVRSIVVAGGSFEPPIDFPGSDLAGMRMSTDVQAQVNLRNEAPGRRALVVGSDNAPLLVAEDLRRIGCEVVAIIEEGSRVIGRPVNLEQVEAVGVPVMTSTRLLAARGDGAVERAVIAEVGTDGGTIQGTEREIDVDLVCLAPPRVPRTRLTRGAGTTHEEHASLGGTVPVHNRDGATATLGVFVCGDGSGVESGAASMESGRLAGIAAAEHLGYHHPDGQGQKRLARGRLAHLRRGPRAAPRREAKAALAEEHRRAVAEQG